LLPSNRETAISRKYSGQGEQLLGYDGDLHDSYFRALLAVVRFNLLWYLPVFGFAIFLFSGAGLFYGYRDLVVIHRRWTWFALASPSAYFYFSSVIAQIDLPIRLSLMVPIFFERDHEAYRRKYLWTLLTLVGIVVAECFLEVVIWGSFPLPVDGQGHIYIRMVPFLPWPNYPFLARY
jgi:hypothetical protein